MITLDDGRDELYQFDTGRKVVVDASCSFVHFSNNIIGRAVKSEVIDGKARIPDELLQSDKPLSVWAFVGSELDGYTKISKVFKVNRKNKPSDYVFTPTEQLTLAGLKSEINELKESQDPDAIKNAVNDYLEKNPVDVPDKLPNPHSLTLTGAVEAEYDGSNPVQVEIPTIQGAPGKTPVKGEDYFTPAEIAEIAQQAAGMVEIPECDGIAVSGASVGQTVRIAAVDDTGKPTAWEAVEFPSGGVGEIIETILSETLTEAVSTYEYKFTDADIDKINSAKIVRFLFDAPSGTAAIGTVNFGIYRTYWYGYTEKFITNQNYASGINDKSRSVGFGIYRFDFLDSLYSKQSGFMITEISGKTESTGGYITTDVWLEKGNDSLKLTSNVDAAFPIGTVIKVEVIV